LAGPRQSAGREHAGLPSPDHWLRRDLLQRCQARRFVYRADYLPGGTRARFGDARVARRRAYRPDPERPRTRPRSACTIRAGARGGGEGAELHELVEGVRRRTLSRRDARAPEESEPERAIATGRTGTGLPPSLAAGGPRGARCGARSA